MRFIIITGLSGAGKTQVIRCMEDLGYYCIDNMPPVLLPKFAEICQGSSGKINKVAMVIDIRGGDMFSELIGQINYLSSLNYEYEILFLDADDNTLVSRYKETRRMHPLVKDGGSILEGIQKERETLASVKERANHVIDTSLLKASQLKDVVREMFVDDSYKGMVINITSFGYKYGIILDSDLVFDVRFLPNPFYLPELKERTGLESSVQDYVMSFPQAKVFSEKLKDMVSYLIPYYMEEGKNQLVIGIGCTGGQHRSVTIALELYEYLKNEGYNVVINHRDVFKDRSQG